MSDLEGPGIPLPPEACRLLDAAAARWKRRARSAHRQLRALLPHVELKFECGTHDDLAVCAIDGHKFFVALPPDPGEPGEYAVVRMN